MASFKEQTGKDIDEAFWAFHAKNPVIYDLFKRYLKELLKAKGIKTPAQAEEKKFKTSSKLLINRIRWEVYVTTEDDAASHKISDAYTSRYSRLFAAQYPEWKNIFNYAELRSK
jgi:hypothetical protein